MKKEDLEAIGLTEEQIKKVREINGADIENAKKDMKDQLAGKDKVLKEKEDAIKDLNEQIKTLEGDSDKVKDLQKKVDDYEKAEKDRAEKEKADKADREMTEKITEIFGESKFTSDYVKNGLIADIKRIHAEDSTKGLKDIYDELTKDKEGIFVNKQKEEIKLPPAGGSGSKSKDEENKIRKVMGLPPLKD